MKTTKLFVNYKKDFCKKQIFPLVFQVFMVLHNQEQWDVRTQPSREPLANSTTGKSADWPQDSGVS